MEILYSSSSMSPAVGRSEVRFYTKLMKLHQLICELEDDILLPHDYKVYLAEKFVSCTGGFCIYDMLRIGLLVFSFAYYLLSFSAMLPNPIYKWFWLAFAYLHL